LITISKNHVLILFLEDGGFLVSDMNSTNGTCVNGLNIKEQLLKNGDTIQIGSVKLEFQV
jgi:pSer/pThr/pTyr-binding forkhead associated (FHA) protein